MTAVEEQNSQQQPAPTSSSTGLDPKLGGLLAYLLGWLTGLILFLVEKDNKYIRFHAMQSILLSIAVFVIEVALGIVVGILTRIPGIGLIVGLAALPVYGLLGLAVFGLWIFMMIKGYNGYDTGEYYKLPFIGNMAEKQA